MKKIFLLLFFSLSFSLFLANHAEARSGCCSHHDGVCGCGCCDGTPLSATCAPYYPSCNDPVDEPEYIEEVNVVESNNDAPAYKAETIINSIETNNSNIVVPVVENDQVNNTGVQEIAPITDELEQSINLEDDTNKTENNIDVEQSPSVPDQSTQVPVGENKTSESGDVFWGSLVFLGLVGYVIHLVKKNKNNNV